MNIKEIIQRLKNAMDDARGQESHFESWLTQNEGICDAIDALKELDKTEQEPVAFPRQVGDSTWTVDTGFIWRVKHTIDPDTPHDFTPSEEQIETVLLSLEKIPSSLYTTPPQRTWVGLDLDERAACYEKSGGNLSKFADQIESKLREKNT